MVLVWGIVGEGREGCFLDNLVSVLESSCLFVCLVLTSDFHAGLCLGYVCHYIIYIYILYSCVWHGFRANRSLSLSTLHDFIRRLTFRIIRLHPHLEAALICCAPPRAIMALSESSLSLSL